MKLKCNKCGDTNIIVDGNTNDSYCGGCGNVFHFSELVKENATSKATDSQIGGSHYDLPIQPIEFILKNDLNFCQGNVIKYICRYSRKNGIEDLEKAKQYVDFLIDQEKGKL